MLREGRELGADPGCGVAPAKAVLGGALLHFGLLRIRLGWHRGCSRAATRQQNLLEREKGGELLS